MPVVPVVSSRSFRAAQFCKTSGSRAADVASFSVFPLRIPEPRCIQVILTELPIGHSISPTRARHGLQLLNLWEVVAVSVSSEALAGRLVVVALAPLSVRGCAPRSAVQPCSACVTESLGSSARHGSSRFSLLREVNL